MDGGRDSGAGRSGTDVERLVGRVAAGEEGDPRWSALLRVLTAASRGADVDPEREQAAVIAFRAASNAGPAPRTGTRRPARSARALAGGLAAVLALCAVVLAAVTGVLPARGGPAHGGPLPAPVTRTAAPAPAGALPDATRRAAPSPRPATRPPAPRRTGTAAPHRDRWPAAVRAVCRRYLAAAGDGRAPASRPSARPRREAGGRRRAAAYCRGLLSGGPRAAPK